MPKYKTPAWQRKEGQSPSGGLSAKGRASYKAETGGTLHAAHVAVNGLFLTFFAFRSERASRRQKEREKEKAFEKQELSRLERGIAIKHDPSPLAESLLRDLAARENLSASSEASSTEAGSTGAFRELTLSTAREESRS